MKSVELKSGGKMPLLGLGTWKSEGEALAAAILRALECGYRHIDCAPIYGNEQQIGRALGDALSAVKVSREDLWLTSKLWNACHRPGDVLPACMKTLNDLKVDYLDLYLIHWPLAFKPGIEYPASTNDILRKSELPIGETWGAMEKLVEMGLVKNIGVSNFNISNLQELLFTAKIGPAVNQVECHPYLQQADLLRFCRSSGIHVTAYSPLGSSDRPDSLKSKDEKSLLECEQIQKIAEKHGVSPAVVLIAWHISEERSVIPKSTSAERIKENFQASSLQLDSEDLGDIRTVTHQQRCVSPKDWFAEGSPYREEDIWSNQKEAMAV